MDDAIKTVVLEEQLKKEVARWNVRSSLQGLPLDKVLEHQPKMGFAVALLNIDGGLNIGSMIRSAVIFGADKVYLIGSRRFDRRSTVGSHNYVLIDHIPNGLPVLEKIKDDGYNPVAIEQGGATVSREEFASLKNPCFLFGSEAQGLDKSITDHCPCYEIHQYGVLRSLNVSSAAAIVLYEFSNGFKL